MVWVVSWKEGSASRLEVRFNSIGAATMHDSSALVRRISFLGPIALPDVFAQVNLDRKSLNLILTKTVILAGTLESPVPQWGFRMLKSKFSGGGWF